MGSLLEVRDLVTRFRSDGAPIHAVNGVSLDPDAGASLAIVGESGCGKSVTMMSVMRLNTRTAAGWPTPPGSFATSRSISAPSPARGAGAAAPGRIPRARAGSRDWAFRRRTSWRIPGR